MFKFILIGIMITLLTVIFFVLRSSRIKPIDEKKVFVRVKTDKGILAGELISINYRTGKAWVKVDGDFEFYELKNVELIKTKH